MVTVRDVAARAGVSPRTVSNVVNEHPHVSAETRRRVELAISETGYRPNLTARSLRQGRSGLIGLVVPEVDVPYFAELTRAFIDVLGEEYTLVVDQTDGRPERERDVVFHRGRAGLFDGLILNPLQLGADELARRGPGTPLVLIGEQVTSELFDHVVIDNVEAAREAVRHLTSQGRRRIAVVGGERESWTHTTMLRAQGYREALEEAGLPYRDGLDARTGALHRADGARAMAHLLSSGERPDAVFCLNDLVALGALRTLATAGVRVPDDVAVVGFDDVEDGRFSTPTLTTVAPDKAQIARLAVERLRLRMAGDTSPGATIVADHRLVVRESTAGPARAEQERRRRPPPS
ncbi:transcriptional regulator, LacI family [Beutenbergia cavernae DSM 12333]|uniref:Transcriptional regulator, LacI family n=1 Tax=Beutenbergia cavernae (strain ATCC BAA-8 / DSM 12333 / CCUG 43141 / JCM 11478 / NBRC 16432 / NCIMB 13614 / HKI 0122) TaxID=471853 RepID=C5BZI1_BEUC1|nr:LacI family DNA-binding transcriptional regulator [Beutenbergia cavernae]ACQ79153.1 transcriptional regulator, LacI family [Beutenbergia cavernae DSM 12333]